jgi:hypothetical protein
MTIIETQQPSFWTRHPEAIETLRKMWVKGYRVIEILTAIGGNGQITKNAIVGKAHRLKLDQHPSAYNRRGSGNVKGTPKKKRRLYIRPEILLEESMSEVKRIEIEMKTPPVNSADFIHLFDTQPNQCRWIMGEAKDMMCCGAPVPEESHLWFCPYHRKRAIRQRESK